MNEQMQVGVAKGCLAGLALSLAFVVVSGLIYLAAQSAGLSNGVSLAIGIGGGPVVVSAVVLGAFVMRVQQRLNQVDRQDDDAATSGYDT